MALPDWTLLLVLGIICLAIFIRAKRRPAFKYKPLTSEGEIRLFLILNAPKDDSPIEGLLWHRSLGYNRPNPAGSYEALSYVWGTEQQQQKKRKILCDGNVLEVPENLYMALKGLRSRSHGGRSRLIWADALCINQADKEELGHQVKIMEQIYRNAKRVEIWLGERSGDSDIAMEFIPKLVHQLQIMDKRKGTDVRVGFDDHEKFGLPHKDDEEWIALSRLLRRLWFTRAWVVQELAVSAKARVSCGAHEVNWSYFESLYELSRRFGLRLHRDVPEVADSQTLEAFGLMYNTRKSVQQGDKLPLIKILRATRHLASKWPQDKVFALLGLASDGARYLRHVDYTEHTAAETFQAVASTLILKGDLFGVLSQVRHPTRIEELPSWVPDWSYDEDALRPGYPFHLHPENCRAGKGSGYSSVKFSLNGWGNSKLTLPGGIVTSLKALSETMEHVREGPDVLEYYDALDRECRDLAYSVSSYPTRETIEEAQWRTRIGNLAYNIRTADASYGKSYAAWREYIRMALAQEEGEAIDMRKFARLDAQSDAFATAQGQQIGGRKFAVTSDRYFGLVPGSSEVGDEVCIFMEAATPFVVRPCGSEWMLVGECYIHGLMNGEALRRSSFYFMDRTLV